MKEIFEKLKTAASDAELTDAAFRRVVRDTFDRRQHNETILTAFLRALDFAKNAQESVKSV